MRMSISMCIRKPDSLQGFCFGMESYHARYLLYNRNGIVPIN